MLKVKQARLEKGWNQTQLAYHARLTVADVSRIETARMRPYAGQARRLGRVLGLAPDELTEPVADAREG